MMARKQKQPYLALFRGLCWIEAALLLAALFERAV